jgi:hypothetical protein
MKRFVFSLAILLSAFIFSQPVLSEEKQGRVQIEGAFGMKLGEPVSGSIRTSSKSLDDGTEIHYFSPKNNIEYFEEYWVRKTPLSKKVYSIEAETVYESRHQCEIRFKAIAELLKRTYSSGERNDFGPIKSFLIRSPHRLIQVGCFPKLKGATLKVVYKDENLLAVVGKEAVEVEMNKLINAGL